jgi:hypothetical protein
MTSHSRMLPLPPPAPWLPHAHATASHLVVFYLAIFRTRTLTPPTVVRAPSGATWRQSLATSATLVEACRLLAKDRAMDPQQLKDKGRVSKISNLKVNPTLIHPDYDYERSPCDRIPSDTGHVLVLKVIPKSGHGPYFEARWDQKPEQLDIDMRGAPRREMKKFKAEKDGYIGHHRARRTGDPNERCYEIKIQTPLPRGKIFEGTVSFVRHLIHPVATGTHSLKGSSTRD